MKTVKKGKHYPFCKGIFPLIYNSKSFEKEITFSEKSVFIFLGDDIYDWSKLFGFSFGHHQKNESYRWGFRFLDDKNVEVVEYMYVNGQRKIGNITKLDLNKKYIFSLDFDKDDMKIYYTITHKSHYIYNSVYNVNNFKWWGYSLGLYIGGNNPAPNKIKIDIKTSCI